MAGVNQYRRRWSTHHQYRRSRTKAVGRIVPIVIAAALLAVTLYVFGVVGPTTSQRAAVPTLTATLIPPPAPLVVPTTTGAVEPFGALPPIAPLANDAPRPALTYQLSGPLTGGASRADVFSVTWGAPSAAQVDTLARKLDITGPVRQPQVGVYTADGNGSLSVDAKATVYVPPPVAATTNALPDDRTAISSTRNWLATRGFLPSDVGPADVQRNGGTLDVIFHPSALPLILSDRPGIRVRIGPGNVVQQVERAWPSALVPGAYDLVSLDEAWQQAQVRGAVTITPPAGVAVPPNAVALVNDVSLAYAVGSDTSGKDYLQPVYLFSGTVAIPGQPTGADVRIAVPAVRNTQQPAG
jgi:hypothetical protein